MLLKYILIHLPSLKVSIYEQKLILNIYIRITQHLGEEVCNVSVAFDYNNVHTFI